VTDPHFSPSRLAALAQAARAILPRFGFAADAPLELISVSENATFRIGAHEAVLRVHRRGYHDAAAIASELEWIKAVLRDGAASAAAPLQDAEGRHLAEIAALPGEPPHAAVLFRHLPGREPAPAEDLAPSFRKLGAIAAGLHEHARRWPRPPGFRRQTWDAPAMLGPAGLWGDWRANRALDASARRLIEAAAARIVERLAAFGRGPDRFGLIHADLRLANLLIAGEDLHVIDFDDCGFGWLMYDFAASVSFMEDAAPAPALRDAWIEGYRSRSPLPDADVAIIPTLVMARRILLVAWMASHPEAEAAIALGPAYASATAALAEAYLAGRFLA
jgi:Ser/Thr protein kinase RdoA (MazF antagonist)